MKSAGSGRVWVAVQASDPISDAGLTDCLESHGELVMLPATGAEDADVVILAPTMVNVGVLAEIRHVAERTGAPVVLVADEISEAELLTAIECRVVAVLPRAATGERLANSVLAAASGGGVLSPNLLGKLCKHVERLQRDIVAHHGLDPTCLSPREIDVLRLMAEGLDTVEIARELCYSERIVKNISYTVAYAIRPDMI